MVLSMRSKFLSLSNFFTTPLHFPLQSRRQTEDRANTQSGIYSQLSINKQQIIEGVYSTTVISYHIIINRLTVNITYTYIVFLSSSTILLHER